MQMRFNRSELETLKNDFRLTTIESGASVCSEKLLQVSFLNEYLDELRPKFKAPNYVVTALQFSKRYAYLVSVHALYAMTAYNKQMELSFQNIYIEGAEENGIWLPKLRLEHLQTIEPIEGEREKWRDTVLRKLFLDHLAPVWQALQNSACAPVMTLWENTALYISWLYEQVLANHPDEVVRKRAAEDFHYLIHEASSELFGTRFQPLTKFYSPQNTRQTCCLYYQLDGADYCRTCPKR
ncbi:IucA/IucC family C-terminal-domain containing protein [Bacillus tianshenii]|nr:IucA/IucC family C-terminal-domain containing protein [Bacillus tianshenii]